MRELHSTMNSKTNIKGSMLQRYYSSHKIKYKQVRVSKNRIELHLDHELKFLKAKRLLEQSDAAGKRRVYVDEMTITASRWLNKAFHQANKHHFVNLPDNKKYKTIHIVAGVSKEFGIEGWTINTSSIDSKLFTDILPQLIK